MSALIYYVTIVVGFVALICFYLKRKYSYWSNRNVPGPTPIWLLGNMHQQLTSNVQQLDVEWMKKYGKLYGTYIALTPVITIADPELIKQTIIKDFHYFVNRIDINSYHELWNTNLFVSKDDSWKRIRTIASPSFTSGKLRAMASIMRRSIDNLDQYLKKMSINENKSINVKQTIAGFTIDVIASTAFATDTNANSEEDNPLVVNGRKMMDFPIFRAMSTFLFPKPILDFLGIHYMWDPKYFSFFIDLTTHIVKKRRAECNGNNQIKHHDLIQLMMDANVDEEDLQKFNYEKMIANDDKEITTEQSKQPENDSRKRKLTDVEVISNCIFFFMAGYETTSSTISHCIYELAKNQSIQNRLFKDLKETLNDLDESSDEYFDKVMTGIPYLEAVIKETLRRYAPLSQINRVCTKDGYQLGNIKLSAGQVVVISIVSVHMNPEYYPEPQTFNPDRFMPENRNQLVPYAYMPFALGPRNCLAMRFAYQEIKLCLARIIRKFRFERNEGTPDQLSYKIGSGLLNSKEFSVKVETRDE